MARTIQDKKGVNGTAENPSGERLSPGTENYLLCLYKLWEDSSFPTTTQLTDTLKQVPVTEGLGTSVPSVAGMVRRMQRQGLVEIGKDKRIRLTKKGTEGGADIARRHRLAEWLVVRLLGMDLYKAHVEAHRLEHAISPYVETKLAQTLGYPKTNPVCLPIPGYSNDLGIPPMKPLAKTVAGESTVVERVPEEDRRLLQFFDEQGLKPGTALKIKEVAPFKGTITLLVGEQEVVLGMDVADTVLVEA